MSAHLVCTAASAGPFKQAMQGMAPEAWALAAALHRAGLIDGLRGMRIAPLPEGLPRMLGAVTPVLSFAAEKRLADLEWERKLRAEQEAKP